MKFNFTIKNCVLLVIILIFSGMLLCELMPNKEGMKEGAGHEETDKEEEEEEVEEEEVEEEEVEEKSEKVEEETDKSIEDLEKLEKLLGE